MTRRWLTQLQNSLPPIDMVDLVPARDPLLRLNRQSAPEYSQAIYRNEFKMECVIGDYVCLAYNSVKVTEEVRMYMITVIIEVHRLKSYKEETLYLACNLADRYLAILTILEKPSPCLIRLAFVCMLMAAKLEEPV
jgi:hypothetical protein